MKLTTSSDPMEDDPMSDSNKENIITKQSSSQVPFTAETDPHNNLTTSSDCKSSSPSSSSSENTLAMKQTALVSNTATSSES